MATNLLINSNFTQVGSNGMFTSFTGTGGRGDSAAYKWWTWNNTEALLETELILGGEPVGALNLLRVSTSGGGNGLVQVFLQTENAVPSIIASAWVYVVRGTVAIGTGLDGHTERDVVSTTVGQWELLSAKNGVSPANQFIIYSNSSEGSTFYVHSAEVLEV